MTLLDRTLVPAEQRRRSRISWRKVLLLHRGPLLEAWEWCFPRHSIIDLCLKNRAVMSKPQPTPRPTPQVVIEAIMLCVRERGLGALQESANLERLERCDEAARQQINQRIAKLSQKTGVAL